MKQRLQISYLISVIGMCVTFFFSMLKNPIMTSLIRAIVCFGLFFVVSFVFIKLMSLVFQPLKSMQPQDAEHLGQRVDLSTPDDVTLPDQNSAEPRRDQGGSQDKQPEEGFAPLNLPHLKRNEQTANPEEMAKALRHLSDSDE
ncbi:hypothetical protein [Marinicrinis sediminis]|uniref:Uncharacterized protein n=1 Tax=Marinicrinis sediminis TaxID=1652465 RepID=A0ABW5R4Y9_9BACL